MKTSRKFLIPEKPFVNDTSTRFGANAVKIPMMPKGVEHITFASEVEGLIIVKIPMMPKGVEHWMQRASSDNSGSGEDSNDAERR